MKKFYLTLILGASILNCFAQTSIWKVSKNGSELYLGGSVHILRPGDFPLPAEYDSAFEKAEKIVFEADIAKLENPETGQLIIQKGMLEESKTLKDVLSEEVYNELKTAALQISLPIDNMARLKPSMVILTLAFMKLQQLGVSSEGIDKFFYSKSVLHDKEVSFLETINEQIELLVNMGMGKEDEFIRYSLKDFDRIEKEFVQIIASWRNGTSKVMKKQLNEMKSEFPEIYKSMMIERNNNWLPQIENYLSDEKVEFVLVGALHLHGSDGLLNKLKKHGYAVKQYRL